MEFQVKCREQIEDGIDLRPAGAGLYVRDRALPDARARGQFGLRQASRLSHLAKGVAKILGRAGDLIHVRNPFHMIMIPGS